jgi:hypothetical protein
MWSKRRKVNEMTNELAIIDAEIQGAGEYNVTYEMLQLVTEYMVTRCVEMMLDPNITREISTSSIAEHFCIPYALAEKIHEAIVHHPPESLKAVTMSLSWRGKITYENPNY